MDTKTLINILSENLDKDSETLEKLLNSLVEIIIDSVREGNVVAIPGFGQFESKLKAERISTHPSTGKKILVPPKLSMVFKPSTLLKQKVRNF